MASGQCSPVRVEVDDVCICQEFAAGRRLFPLPVFGSAAGVASVRGQRGEKEADRGPTGEAANQIERDRGG